MTWTSSGNLGPPNPLGTSGFASSGLIFARTSYHSIVRMSENTPVKDGEVGINHDGLYSENVDNDHHGLDIAPVWRTYTTFTSHGLISN